MLDIDINKKIYFDDVTRKELTDFLINRYCLFLLKKFRHDGSEGIYLDSRYDVTFQVSIVSEPETLTPLRCYYLFVFDFVMINGEHLSAPHASCAISTIDELIENFYSYI